MCVHGLRGLFFAFLASVKHIKKEPLLRMILVLLVDATRFELATSASRTQRSTKLSHASILYSTQSGKLVFQISEGFMYLQNHTQKFISSIRIFPTQNLLVKPSTY